MSPRRSLAGVVAGAGLDGKARGSEEPGAGGSESIVTLFRGVFTEEELGKANGEELSSGAKRGVRGCRRGVLDPTARLAAIPVNGLLAAACASYRWRAGVPAADGVPSRNNL